MASNNDTYNQFDNDEDILEEYADLKVRPFMQTTVVAAEYNNDFFDPTQGNTTYRIVTLPDDLLISNWDKVSAAITEGTVSPSDILQIIEIALNMKCIGKSDNLLAWSERPSQVVASSTELSTTRLMNAKVASGIVKQYATDEDYTLVSGSGDDGEPPEEGNVDSNELKVKAASYLCLCLMRLLKKDPANFMKGIPSIKRGFSLFFEQASSTVMNFEFSKAAIIAISDGLRSNAKLGQTMIYHVAYGMKDLDRTSQEYHLMRFTFCQHVELKGLHAYKLFYELDKVFNDRLPTPVFLSWLTNDTTYKAVMQIAKIIKEYDNEKKTSEYLWLYARYLNNGYFYDLHTARCRWLVCVLAHLHKSQIPNTNASQGSPLDLLELKKMPTAEWATAKEYAEIFIEQYTRQTAASAKMNRIQRAFQTKRGIPTPKPVTKRKRQESDAADDMDTAENIVEPNHPPATGPSRKRHMSEPENIRKVHVVEENSDEDEAGAAPEI